MSIQPRSIHPLSAMETARLAEKLLNDGSWEHISRVEAREITASMTRLSLWGPAEDSPGARVLAAHMRRLSGLANAAIAENALLIDGRDLSWLRDPMQMDEMARQSFVY